MKTLPRRTHRCHTHRAAGICVRCGHEPAVTGATLCAPCREKTRSYARAYQRRRRAIHRGLHCRTVLESCAQRALTLRLTAAQVIDAIILSAYRRTCSQEKAARLLGLSRRTITRAIQRLRSA